MKRILCWFGFHKFTKWQEDLVAPIGFGRYRRECKWCGRQEAKN